MMPKKDGFALAQEIRTVNSEVPIIFLTAKSIKEDILEGFKIGADDYITKPFSMEELVFRIEAILRRVKGKKGKEITMYKIGKFTFDTQKQVLLIDDKVTKLTTKESELLSLLCAHVNEILERNFALEDNLDRRQLLQRPLDGRLYHQAPQASERRPLDRNHQHPRQGLQAHRPGTRIVQLKMSRTPAAPNQQT